MADKPLTIIVEGQELPVVPMPMPEDKFKTNDRISLKVDVYHQHIGSQPVHAECMFDAFLETFDLEPEKKRLKAEQDIWKFLPIGDLEVGQIGMIVVQNLAGKNYQSMPTEEEKAADTKRHILIREAGVTNGLELIVRSGRAFAFEVINTRLEYTSTFEATPGIVWVFPK